MISLNNTGNEDLWNENSCGIVVFKLPVSLPEITCCPSNNPVLQIEGHFMAIKIGWYIQSNAHASQLL